MMVKATFDQARFDELLRAKRVSAASLEAAGQISLFGGHASPEHAGLVPKQVTVAAHTTAQGVHVPAHQATVYARAANPTDRACSKRWPCSSCSVAASRAA
jgi:hypothetical protein